jgi:hypothetical protein
MLLVRRPKTPAGFNRAARVARATVRNIIEKNERPKSDQFMDKWGPFKHVLAEAQHHRCGYCDRKVLGGDDGTVDHFRPKAEIEALLDDPTTWGTQKAHSASLRERATEFVSELGYHWLAYAWSNYVFACSSCNEKWKRALFPIATHPRCCPPRPRSYEEPLLLCCYSTLRPSDHIQFNPDGTVEPFNGSPYGYETIRTVGLYREPLCDERKHVAEDVFYALDQLAEGDEATAIPSLKRLGNEDRPFAGVARAIVEQNMGILWEDFLALYPGA